MATIRTVAAPLTVEGDKVKGSRFIADVAPGGSEAAALAVVDSVRSREPAATHHCWAFVLSSGRARSSDDGEPAGSAGDPIRRHIGGSGLVDVVVVVTRYYGGTKLGVGGLVRAYGGAAGAALSQVQVIEQPLVARVEVVHGYDLTGPVEGVLAAFGAVVVSSAYGAQVVLAVEVAAAVVDAFVGAIVETTAGQVMPSIVTPSAG